MRDGPRGFPQNSSCSAVLRCRLAFRSVFRVRGCHPLRPRFPACSAMDRLRCRRRSYNPGRCQRQPRFGLMRVRSPLLAQSFLLSLPPGTKMFQFPGFAPDLVRCRHRCRRVSPFGHPRVTGHLPLTAAFRSLSRPSSPPRATGIPRAPLFTFFYLYALPLQQPHAQARRGFAGQTFAYIRLARFLRFSKIASFSRFAFPPCQ